MQPTNARHTARIIVCVGLLILVADRISKWLALQQWAGQPIDVLPGVQLLLLVNRGIAFSMPFVFPLLTVVITALMVLIAVWCARSLNQKQWMHAAFLGIILLGAASNLLDRFLYGGVVDYLHIIVPSVINLADVMIVAGVAGLFFAGKSVV